QSQPQGPAPAAAPRASSLPKQNHDADATMIFSIAGPGAGASAGAGPRLRIKVLETPDPSQRREETISSFPCVIGRGDVAFPLAGDSSMSRKHAEISVQGSSFTITDLNSGNGIFIDGQRQAAGQPVRIDGRTTVRVGLFTTLELEPK
ncbi:MAG TPA: FHA domain-containing protein, partial [Herpetosiphonaceae bacterium]